MSSFKLLFLLDALLYQVLELFRQTMDLSPSFCPFQDGDCSFAKLKKGTVRGKFLVTDHSEHSVISAVKSVFSSASSTIPPLTSALN